MKKGSIGSLEWKERFSYVKNVPFAEKDLHCKGAKFQIVKFRPGASIKPHYHRKTYEIFFVEGGEGIIGMNGKRETYKPGDFVLCEPGDIHEFVNEGTEEFVVLIFKTNEGGDEDIYWE